MNLRAALKDAAHGINGFASGVNSSRTMNKPGTGRVFLCLPSPGAAHHGHEDMTTRMKRATKNRPKAVF
jgi:hypothetical protein